MPKAKIVKILVVIFIISISLFSIFVCAQSLSNERYWDGYTYEIDNYSANAEITLIKIHNPKEKVVIPSTICFKEVDALGGYSVGTTLWGPKLKGMFEENNVVKEVEVSEGIKYIWNKCFCNFISVEKITFPSTIKQFSIYNCQNLREVIISEKAEEIESFGISKCALLESIVIPENVSEDAIDYGAFSGCKSLKSINIPDKIRYINQYTFSGCSSLKDLDLSKNVIDIGRGAFLECTSLERINIYESVTNIADDAFEGCDKLTIYGIKDSYAEQYANEHNIPFKELN